MYHLDSSRSLFMPGNLLRGTGNVKELYRGKFGSLTGKQVISLVSFHHVPFRLTLTHNKNLLSFNILLLKPLNLLLSHNISYLFLLFLNNCLMGNNILFMSLNTLLLFLNKGD